MLNSPNGASWRRYGNRRGPRWTVMIGLSIGVWLLSSSGCRSQPEPCNCGLAEQELRAYTEQYHEALEDLGNLRQQLKACQEKH